MRQNFCRAAAHYDTAAVLQREIADRMLQRLRLIRLIPETIVDIGCGTGYAMTALLKKYRKTRIIGLDIAPTMLNASRQRTSWLDKIRHKIHYVCADAKTLPLADASCDLLFANLVLQWCNDLDQVLAEFRRVLRPGGLLMFSTLGPDTLTELRQSWAHADNHRRVHLFLDMHDIGDALLRSRLADPVMDSEYFTLTYQTVPALLGDLKQWGASNVATDRSRGLTGRRRFQTMIDSYEQFRNADNVLPATYEIVYGHAWTAEQTLSSQRQDGTAVFPLSQLRTQLRT